LNNSHKDTERNTIINTHPNTIFLTTNYTNCTNFHTTQYKNFSTDLFIEAKNEVRAKLDNIMMIKSFASQKTLSVYDKHNKKIKLYNLYRATIRKWRENEKNINLNIHINDITIIDSSDLQS